MVEPRRPLLALLHAEGVQARSRSPPTARSRASASVVARTSAGCVSRSVFDGSPARRAGIAAGDVIVAVDGTSLAAARASRRARADQGPAGDDGQARRIARDGTARDATLTRARVTVPVVEVALQALRGDKIGVVALAAFTSGAHGERPRRRSSGAAQARRKGIVLDLRGNGGGLVERGAAGREHLPPRARSSRRAAARCRARRCAATATDLPAARWSCSSTTTRRRPRRSSRRRCRTTTARRSSARARSARASSRRSIELPNGGALDITVGRVLHAERAQPRRRRRQHGQRASRPTSARATTPRTTARRGARPWRFAARCGRRGRSAPPTRDGTSAARRRCSAQRGRFLVAEPFFERGAARCTVERDRRARAGRAGAAAPAGAAARRAKVAARARHARRRPRRDRGADARPRAVAIASRRRRARGERGPSRAAGAAAARAAHDLRELPTFTIDPVDARDFDDAISCER